MQLRKNKTKSYALIAALNLLIIGSAFLSGTYAQNGCQNTVPNPLNPNCDPNVANNLSFGGLIDRFLGIVPVVITIITVFAVARGAIKVGLAPDSEKRSEGFKGIINAAIGAALFYSIWLILFLISYVVGTDVNTIN